MAIENTYLLGKNITLGCGFDLQAKAPLDSRQTVPAFAGLQALIDNNAAYEGMIVFDEETKKTYQAQLVDDVLAFREFGINESELKALIASETTAAMEFKGAATALPENPTKGDMYKVTAAFKVGEEDVKIGDSIVYDGEQWFIIPSGDDIEDTWRPVTGVDNDATLTFAAGDKLEKTVAADGTVTYKHVAIDAPTNMNAEGDEQTRTYITQLITDNHGHVIGFKTATENVEDTNTTYTFEGQSDEATSVYFQVKSSEEDAAEVVYLDAYSKNESDGLLNAAMETVYTKDEADEKFYSHAEGAPNADSDRSTVYTCPTAFGRMWQHGDTPGTAESISCATMHIVLVDELPEKGINLFNTNTNALYLYQLASDAGSLVLHSYSGDSWSERDYANNQFSSYTELINAGMDTIRIQVVSGFIPMQHAYIDGAGWAPVGYAGENFDKYELLKFAERTDVYTKDESDGKFVEKVEGKSLVSDTEITKLAGVSEGANKVENVGDGKIKIDGEEVVVYEHPEKHAIDDVTGLQGALNGKVASVTVGDASVTVGGTNTAPTVAVKISAIDGNALELAEDGLKVIIPESTKVEASETNGNIKVDGQEVTVYTPINDLTDELKGQYDAAYEHSQVAHAPADAQANVIESIKVNGEALAIADKAVDIAVPTGALANKDEVAKDDLAEALKTEIEGKADATQVAADIATAKEEAITEASNQDAVVLSESQNYTDTAKAEAIADAEGKVNALAETLYTKDEVDALLSAAQSWGEF